jgi:phenylacetate-CoA ligase
MISTDLEMLMQSQYWTKSQIDDYQNRKLREMISHCFQNVPFYNELMKKLRLTPSDIRTKEDLHKLPIVTKDDLRNAKGKHVGVNLPPKSYFQNCSSGSTGEPFSFLSSYQAESFSKATNIRAWYWHGYRLGDKYVKLSMNSRSSKLKQLQDLFNRCKYLSSNQLSESSFEAIAHGLHAYDPLFIRGYPVPMFFLAEVIAKKYGGYQGKSLLGINTTGTTLHDDVRKKIEDTFHTKVFDSYSCEGGANFTECPICGAYHPSEEYAISEFVADSFSANEADFPLRHITTDLVNFASPFIRYDTQDYMVLKDKTKWRDCTRPYLQVESIKGRDGDILVTPSGKYLLVDNFAAYFEFVPQVDLIQVIQDKIDHVDINMVVNSGFDDQTHRKIKEFWDLNFGEGVHVDVNVVDTIQLSSAGKRRTVIRNPDIKLND